MLVAQAWVGRRCGTTIAPASRSRIRELAIVVLTLIFAAIWSPIGTFIFNDASRAQGEVVTANAEQDTGATVELDVFSGRPNPSWTLTPAQGVKLRQLLRAVRDLPKAHKRGPPAEPGLGYRGLILRISVGSTTETWRVGQGAAEFDGQSYPDNGRHIEIYVLDTMPPDLRAQFASVLPPL